MARDMGQRQAINLDFRVRDDCPQNRDVIINHSGDALGTKQIRVVLHVEPPLPVAILDHRCTQIDY